MSRYALIFALLFTACRLAPLSYHLAREGQRPVLIPPGQRLLSSTPGSQVSVKNARRTPSPNLACDIEGGLIALHWRGTTAGVRFTSRFNAAPPGEFTSLGGIAAFRANLLDLQSKTCLTSADIQRLLRAITEKLPLPPSTAYQLRFGNYGSTSFFDLSPGLSLEIVRPIFAEGGAPPAGASAGPSANKVVGFETSDYILNVAQNDARVRLSLASVTEFRPGKPLVEKSAPFDNPPFPTYFAYLRLVFRRSVSAEGQVTIATILALADESRLNDVAKLFEAAQPPQAPNTSGLFSLPEPPPENVCNAVAAPGVTCITFPSTFGVNPTIQVLVNGKEIFVPAVEANIGWILEDTKSKLSQTDLLKTLQVRRQFQGHLVPIQFDRATPDILDLSLMPGDVITW